MPKMVQFDTDNFSIFVPSTKVYVSHGRCRITRSKLRFPPGQEFTVLVPQSPRPLGEFSSFADFLGKSAVRKHAFGTALSPFDLPLNKHCSPVRPASRIVLTQLL